MPSAKKCQPRQTRNSNSAAATFQAQQLVFLVWVTEVFESLLKFESFQYCVGRATYYLPLGELRYRRDFASAM